MNKAEAQGALEKPILSEPIFCNTEISLEYKFHEGGSHFYNHSVGVGPAYKFDF